jgi:hypothetical protein
MPDAQFPGILTRAADLIRRSIEQGILLSPDHGGLVIRIPKNKSVNKELLQELSGHKGDLIEYFNCFKHSDLDPGGLRAYANTVIHQGQPYYRLSPIMLYWVNDQVDSGYKQADDIHGTSMSCWQAEGNFDPTTFVAAFQYLVQRHESLRTTIHYLDGEYLAKTETGKATCYIPEYIDLLPENTDKDHLEKLIRFEGHAFDLQTGPLVLVRIIRIAASRFKIALKIHHCITDAWSNDVLTKDLLTAYQFMSERQPVQLPALNYQLKDYLAWINSDGRDHYERDKEYWNNLHPLPPPSLTIPGAHSQQTDWQEKRGKVESFVVGDGLPDRLSALSKAYATSIFIILQATFKYFLYCKTGQQDIIIGTYVLGRDYPGLEEQVGCYARAMFVRSVLVDVVSFPDAINKVKKANEDMQQYKSYRLLDAIRQQLQGNQTAYGPFWKINLQYTDFRRSFSRQGEAMVDALKDNDVRFEHEGMASNSHVAIDMQLRYIYYPDKLELFVEYDSSSYTPTVITDFISDYIKFTQQVTS